MSRGPGALGRRILAELEAAPGGRLQWRLLKQRFPHQVEDKGFYASIRSLKRLGRILDHGEGDTRYIYLAPVYHAGGRANLAFEADRTFAALCDEADELFAAGATSMWRKSKNESSMSRITWARTMQARAPLRSRAGVRPRCCCCRPGRSSIPACGRRRFPIFPATSA